MTNELYDFNTDDIKIDKAGLPLGQHKVMIVGEDADDKGRGVVLEYEILDGEHKGKRGKQWLLTKHSDAQTSNIAKQNVKRLADATGRAVSAAAPLKNRVLTIAVRQQKKNPEYTEIFQYLPENAEKKAPF